MRHIKRNIVLLHTTALKTKYTINSNSNIVQNGNDTNETGFFPHILYTSKFGQTLMTTRPPVAGDSTYIFIVHAGSSPPILSHWGWDKMAAIFQTKFWKNFLHEKFKILIKSHWYLFPSVQLTMCQRWFRQWLGADQVPLSEPMAI